MLLGLVRGFHPLFVMFFFYGRSLETGLLGFVGSFYFGLYLYCEFPFTIAYISFGDAGLIGCFAGSVWGPEYGPDGWDAARDG